MKLFNKQTNKIEPLPTARSPVTIYFWGAAPREAIHLGDAFAYGTADTLLRYLELKGIAVEYGQIITKLSGNGQQEALADESSWPTNVIETMQALNISLPQHLWPATAAQQQLNLAHCLFSTAESEAALTEYLASGQQAIPFWLQAGHVTFTASKKKVLVRDLLQHHAPDALRIYLAQQHYRDSCTFDELALKKAGRRALKLQAALSAASTGPQAINISPVENRFAVALENDLDTTKGIATLLNLADEILFRAPNGYFLDDAQAALRRMASVFGLQLAGETIAEQIITS